jgi:hypothetical protein
VEPRTRFSLAAAPYMGTLDARTFTTSTTAAATAGCTASKDNDPLLPALVTYRYPVQTWVRHWLLVEFVANPTACVSMWVADEKAAPVKIWNRVAVNLTNGGGANAFVFQFYTSQDRADSAGPLKVWFRDFVLLRNVTNAQAIVDDGATVP